MNNRHYLKTPHDTLQLNVAINPHQPIKKQCTSPVIHQLIIKNPFHPCSALKFNKESWKLLAPCLYGLQSNAINNAIPFGFWYLRLQSTHLFSSPLSILIHCSQFLMRWELNINIPSPARRKGDSKHVLQLSVWTIWYRYLHQKQNRKGNALAESSERETCTNFCIPYSWLNICIVLKSIDGWRNILHLKESLHAWQS
jgi:hypothetical protein